MSKSYFSTVVKISLKLLVICAVIAGVVSFVYSATIDAYTQNLEGEKQKAIAGIFADSDSDVIEYTEETGISADVNAVYSVVKNGEAAGFCVNVTSKGFGGELTLMIGYNADGSIKGIQVISHSETPGVGTKALSDAHLSQYNGKEGQLTLAKGSSGDISAVSGATISSKGVNAAVNVASDAISSLIVKQGGIK